MGVTSFAPHSPWGFGARGFPAVGTKLSVLLSALIQPVYTDVDINADGDVDGTDDIGVLAVLHGGADCAGDVDHDGGAGAGCAEGAGDADGIDGACNAGGGAGIADGAAADGTDGATYRCAE